MSSDGGEIKGLRTGGGETPNPRGIPRAPFLEDVDGFMEDKQIEDTLAGMNEMYQKYKFMEESLLSQRTRHRAKVPDIRASLEAVKELNAQAAEDGNDEALGVHFEMADNIYVEAKVPRERVKSVGVWLGARTMVEFPIDEAEALLTKNLAGAELQLSSVDEDLAFLKDQITTSEVNIARLYNWDVKKRREARLAGKA